MELETAYPCYRHELLTILNGALPMTAQAAQKITPEIRVVHESETQRQHIRIGLPAKVKINDDIYKIKDLSVSGLSIATDKELPIDKSARTLRIFFVFDVFAFYLDIKAQPVYFNAKRKEAGFRFVEMKDRQLSLLNYVVKSWLSGSVIREGEIMNVISRDNLTKARNHHTEPEETGLKATLQKVLPTALISVLGIAGLLFFFGNIYENSSIVKSYESVVAGNELNIRAHTEGIFTPLIGEDVDHVQKDQPLATISREDSSLSGPGQTTIKSPCDCYILSQQAQSGEFRAMGEPLFRLLPAESRLWVTATVPPQQAQKLRLQDNVNLKVAGEGTFMEGYVTEIDFIDKEEPVAEIRISPKKALSNDMIGRPAYAEFRVH